MGAISALSDTASALGRNPVLFASAAVLGVAGAAVQATGLAGGPVPYSGLWLLAGFAVVEPLLAGGLLGMADEAVSGRTSPDAFWTHAVENYVDLLVARLVVATAVAAVAGVAVAAALALGVSLVPDPGGGQSMHDPLAGLVPLLTGTVVVVAVLGPPVVLAHVLGQFYPAGVVVADAGALGSFRYSARLVVEHPLAALGYTLVAFVAGVALLGATQVVAGPLVAGAAVRPMVAPTAVGSPAAVVAFAVVVGGARAVRIGLLRTYYVAFVRSVGS